MYIRNYRITRLVNQRRKRNRYEIEVRHILVFFSINQPLNHLLLNVR